MRHFGISTGARVAWGGVVAIRHALWGVIGGARHGTVREAHRHAPMGLPTELPGAPCD